MLAVVESTYVLYLAVVKSTLLCWQWLNLAVGRGLTTLFMYVGSG